MEFLRIIGNIATLVWFFIPIRQYKTRLFLFFLILSLLDPTALLIIKIFNFRPEIIYLIGSIILLYPLFTAPQKINRIILISILLLLGVIAFYFTNINPIIFQIVIHIPIFAYFIKLLITYYGKNRKILLFHLVLVGYEFSLLLKFFIFVTEVRTGLIYYHVTTMLEIFMGIFFLYINEKNSPKITL